MSVDDNSSTTFYGKATNSVNGASSCSTSSITFIEDSVAPESSVSSREISNSASISLDYSASDSSGSGIKEVELWAQGPGYPGFVLSATDTSPSSASFIYNAPGDGVYLFYTRARDIAGNFEESPASSDSSTLIDTTVEPPTFVTTAPTSPSNQNNFHVRGIAETNSTVRLYTSPGCGGSPAAVDSDPAFASPGLSVAASDNLHHSFSRGSWSTEPGNISACSLSSIVYVEDSSPPVSAASSPSTFGFDILHR